MIATRDVCTIVTYLDDVIGALRAHGISVETGFVSGVRRSGRTLSITLGPGSSSLSYATLAWQPDLGWLLTSRQRRPRHWVLPLKVLADPEDVARAVDNLVTSLRPLPVSA